MSVNPAFLEICEERFGALADNLGFCDVCPVRQDFLAFMGEEDPVNVPDGYKMLGARALVGCARAKQIQRGESATVEVDPSDCLAVDCDW